MSHKTSKRLSTIICLVVMFVLLPVLTWAQTQSDTYLRQLIQQKQPGFVYDYAGMVDAASRQNITQLLRELEYKTGAQVKVVVIPSMKGGQIDDFANRLFEGWGIGAKSKDNGVLLLVSLDDRKVRIETGYGIEGAIPDSIAAQIIREDIGPAFKQKQYGYGLLAASSAISDLIYQEFGMSSGRKPVKKSDGKSRLLGLVFLVVFILFARKHPFLAMFLLASSSRGGGYRGGGFGGGGGFSGGGFGGGMSGGGGASGGW